MSDTEPLVYEGHNYVGLNLFIVFKDPCLPMTRYPAANKPI